MNEEENIIAVEKMQVFIEDHLYEAITLKQLAKAAGYSPGHTDRIFKEVTGKKPFEYIRSLRLTEAAMYLRERETKIVDVALDFVFDSQEGFTRAFSKEFGIPPKRYSKETPPIQLFMPYKAYFTYKALNKGGIDMSNENSSKTVFVQIIERPKRKALIKRGIKATDYFEYCNEVGCDIWPMLLSVKEALYEPIGMWLPDAMIKKGTSKYVQGVELPLDYSNIVPEGYELIELPKCMVMIFQGEAYNDDDFMEAINEVWNHIDRFNPEVYGYKWAPEAGPRFQLSPMGYRGYIEGRPVEPINK